jgi:hypothetical protein
MLRSQLLELRILQKMKGEWYVATVPSLALSIDCQEWPKLVDTVKRLHQKGIIYIRKWSEDIRNWAHYTHDSGDESFFYRNEFQMRITPIGRTYAEGLAAMQTLDESLVAQAESFMKQLDNFHPSPLRNAFDEIQALIDREFRMSQLVVEAMEGYRDRAVIADQFRESITVQQSASRQVESLLYSFDTIGRNLATQISWQNEALLGTAEALARQSGIKSLLGALATIGTINLELPKLACPRGRQTSFTKGLV